MRTFRAVAVIMAVSLVWMSVGINPAAGAAPSSPSASASPAKDSAKKACKKQNQKLKKAKKAAKSKKVDRLKKKYRQCLKRSKKDSGDSGDSGNTNIDEVTQQLAGYTYVGARGDGNEVNLTLCRNGDYDSSGFREYIGDGWYVESVKYRSQTQWSAIVSADLKPPPNAVPGSTAKWTVGVVRSGDQFQVGISRFDEVDSPGDVTRSPETLCATL